VTLCAGPVFLVRRIVFAFIVFAFNAALPAQNVNETLAAGLYGVELNLLTTRLDARVPDPRRAMKPAFRFSQFIAARVPIAETCQPGHRLPCQSPVPAPPVRSATAAMDRSIPVPQARAAGIPRSG
jgi:hypothetical protein